MLISQFIPESMEFVIVLTPFIVGELVQHRVDYLLQWQEQIGIVVVPQANADLVATIDVQAKQVAFWWQELGQDLHAKATFAHDGFDGRRHFP